MNGIILSHYQAESLLEAKRAGDTQVQVSLDLGLTTSSVILDQKGVQLPDGGQLGWDQIETIANDRSTCYAIQGGETQQVQFYSNATDRLYSLYPTTGAPTMLISGIPMHRIKDTDPYRDTSEKIRTLKPVVGQVLDTATGLGYTAIQAAKTAEQVTTIELDPAVLEVCRRNPWSQGLLNNPKITQVIGDSFDVVAEMDPNRFTRVIHDPPVFSLAGDLYSADFYCELYRVMRNRARLFHYVGDPDSKSGRNVTSGVMRRLEQAGFHQVHRVPRAFGVTAEK
jgi:predicted methyltransferase